jgi:hypothetical protein
MKNAGIQLRTGVNTTPIAHRNKKEFEVGLELPAKDELKNEK